MIRIVLKGALGNQLFQYAHGKSLSLKYKTPLVLDTSFLKARVPFKKLTPYKHATYRNYYLDIFGIKNKQTTFYKLNSLDKYLGYPSFELFNSFLNTNYIKEGPNPYIYDPTISEKGPKATLNGFWNNYKYFEEYKDEIVKILDTNKLIDAKFQEFEKKINNTNNSVAIHIRRGDYINNKNRNIYIVLDKYYRQAINHIKRNIKKPYFYIFSQDKIENMQEMLKLKNNEYEIVDNNMSGYKDSAHFRFMSICDNNIIANSSYSWWAAYLNKNKKKIVIAPDKWQNQYAFENVKGWKIIKV